MKLEILSRFFGRSTEKRTAEKIYGQIMEQSRKPSFFIEGGVADTLDGRFDAVILHAFLVLQRLKAEGQRGKDLSQAVFDTMFQNLDETLREVGVGDLSVGSKIQNMISAFYGRALAYEEGLAQEDDSKLHEVLQRNLYRGAKVKDETLSLLSAYMRRQVLTLEAMSSEKLWAGEIAFGDLQK